jgi:hypothetical protein
MAHARSTSRRGIAGPLRLPMRLDTVRKKLATQTTLYETFPPFWPATDGKTIYPFESSFSFGDEMVGPA